MKLNGNLTFKTLGAEIRNAVIEKLASDPTAEEGRIYYNTTDNEYRYYNGSAWQPFGEGVIATNIVTASGGIYDTDGTYDGTTVDAAISNVTASTDLLDALVQLNAAIVSAGGNPFQILDDDGDTYVRTESSAAGDQDTVVIQIGNDGDGRDAQVVGTFGRTATTILGSSATTDANGGTLTLGAGDSNGSGYYGGAVNITGGDGHYANYVTISGGTATGGQGGFVYINGGTGGSSYYGGHVDIKGGGSTGYRAGDIRLTGGQTTTGQDGSIFLKTGGTTSETNRISLFGSTSGGDVAGDIEIRGARGDNDDANASANIIIEAGGGNLGNVPGDVTIEAGGTNSAATAGGDVNLVAGETYAGGTAGVSGAGGSINLTASRGEAGTLASGNINLNLRAGSTDGAVVISSADTLAPALRFVEETGTDYVGLKSPDSVATSVTYTLPVAPTDTYLLSTNGSGVMTWIDPAGVGAAGDIDSLTDVTITSGTTNDVLQLNGSSEWVNVAIGATSGLQAYDAGLDSIAALNASSGDVIYATAADTYAVAQPGTTSGVQAFGTGLDSLSGLNASANDIIYATANDAYAVAAPGVTSGVQAYDANLDQIAALAPTTDNFIVGNGSAWTLETPSDARTSLGLVAGGAGDIWVEKAGDTMDSAANLTFAGGGEVLGLPATPSGATAAASKDYVDSLVSGGTVWKDPIVDPDLAGISSTADPSVAGNTVWIAYGGSYPQTWGTYTDVESLDVMARNAADTAWIRLDPLSGSGRFIITGDHGTFGTTDDLYTTANLRSKALIEWVGGSTNPTLAASWTQPSDAYYQAIAFDAVKTGASATGFANDATVYVLDVKVGVAAVIQCEVTGSTAQTLTTLITQLNTDLSGSATVTDHLENGHLHVVADDGTSTVLISEGTATGTGMLATLTDFSEITAGVVNGTTVLVNDPDSEHFGDQFHFSHQGNAWTLIAGPGATTAGDGLSRSGTALNVNFGAGVAQLPTDEVGVDLHDAANGAIILTTDGTDRVATTTGALHLRLAGDDAGVDTNGSALTQDDEGLRLVLTTLSGLTINGAGSNNGTLEVNPKTTTGIAINGGDGELQLAAIPNASLSNPNMVFSDGSTPQTVDLAGTLTFSASAGTGVAINTTTADTVTIAGIDATTAVKGVASFASANFTVASGAVSLATTQKILRIEDADGDTYISVDPTPTDSDEVVIALGNDGDGRNAQTVATFGRAATTIVGTTATTDADGGTINLTGGNGNGSGYYGGGVNIASGNGSYVNYINIDGGNSTSGIGGQINITGGDTSAGYYGGDVKIFAGAGSVYGGGRVFIHGGSGLKDGDVQIATGGLNANTNRIELFGSEDDGDTAGNIDILGADSLLSASAGASINLVAGDGGATGDGGNINLSVHAGTTNDGAVTIISDDAHAPELRFFEQTGSEFVGLKSPDSVTTAVTYTLPPAPASNNYVLQATTAGVMSWVDPTTGAGASRLEDLDDVTANTSGSPVDDAGQILVSDGIDTYDTKAIQFVYDSTLNGGTATSHTVTHSLGQRFVTVTVYDSTYNQILPQTVVLTDANTVTVTFNTTIQCYVVVMGVPGVAAS